jgi:cyanophycinase-like exopeptidase
MQDAPSDARVRETGARRAPKSGLARGGISAVRAARAALAAIFLALLVPAAQAAAESISISRLGFTDSVRARLTGPAFYLKGDGAPEPVSFAEFLGKVSADPVDVVVLGASFREWDGECRAVVGLAQVNSCTTIVIRDAADVTDPEVVDAVNQAEVIYFRGGNQCNFVQWRGSAVMNAVQALVKRGGGTGGGSAGLAIQGALAVYDGCKGSINSAMALAEPFRPSMSLTDGLFHWPALQGTLTDSHFVKRDRMGRMLAFLCRQLAAGDIDQVWGLGINEGAAVLIDRNGIGTIFGEPAYMVLADRPDMACAKDSERVNYAGYKVWRLAPGSHYDFAKRPKTGFYRVDVEQGALTGDPYNPPEDRDALETRMR